MFCRQHLRDGDRQQAQLAEGGLRAKQYFKMRRHKEPEHKLERVRLLGLGFMGLSIFGRSRVRFRPCGYRFTLTVTFSPVRIFLVALDM